MLTIRFLPESDLKDYQKPCKEFETIWRADGDKIVSQLQSVTGLAFREREINAAVFSGPSHSCPLALRAESDFINKRATLIHELGHRILRGRANMKRLSKLENHKILFLVLPEVLLAIGGRELLDAAIAYDRALPHPEYGEAWDYALAFTPEERRREFVRALAQP
ncbi:hypothetical protein HY091_03155 [Candidatus Kaiserbacteria bacterium]|nr:hypothetical protein [Candidatus Kaiserbacteria bacterium]